MKLSSASQFCRLLNFLRIDRERVWGLDALGVGGVLHRAVNSNTNRGIVVINNVIVTVGSAALSVTTISVYPICSTHFHEELITLINIEQHHDHSSFIERNVTSAIRLSLMHYQYCFSFFPHIEL